MTDEEKEKHQITKYPQPKILIKFHPSKYEDHKVMKKVLELVHEKVIAQSKGFKAVIANKKKTTTYDKFYCVHREQNADDVEENDEDVNQHCIIFANLLTPFEDFSNHTMFRDARTRKEIPWANLVDKTVHGIPKLYIKEIYLYNDKVRYHITVSDVDVISVKDIIFEQPKNKILEEMERSGKLVEYSERPSDDTIPDEDTQENAVESNFFSMTIKAEDVENPEEQTAPSSLLSKPKKRSKNVSPVATDE